MSIKDPNYHRMVRIKGFFDHPGWRDFEKEITDLIVYHKSQIGMIVKQKVGQGDLDLLNSHISSRNALYSVLNLREKLIEDVGANSSNEEDVKEPQEV